MHRVIVLGGGMVGGVIARDFAKEKDIEVTVADRDENALQRLEESAPLHTIKADLSEPENVKEIAGNFDLVVGAVPGFLGFRTLKAVIEAGKNYADISFMPENPLELDYLAKENDVVAMGDCGVAPGLSNMLIGHLSAEMDRLEDVKIYVGGLPVVRTWPYEYKAPFSPIDVIEEYTRPVRYRRDGKIITAPALSEPEFIDFPGIGTLEAFNTDGLRTLLDTVDCPNMVEKTLRYPGHRERVLMLRETGFFGREPVEVGGRKIRPIDLTAKLLFPLWKLKEKDEEFTVMRVQVKAEKDGEKVMHTYDLLKRGDIENGLSSMAMCTGYPVSIMVSLILGGEFRESGVIVPEFIGKSPAIFKKFMEKLERKGIVFEHRVEEIP